MDNAVIPRVEMAVRLITGSPGQGPSSVSQNPGGRDFTKNTENTPLMSAYSRLDLNINQDRDDETRSVENFEDGDFPALRPNCDRRPHAHHSPNATVVAPIFKKYIYFARIFYTEGKSKARHSGFLDM